MWKIQNKSTGFWNRTSTSIHLRVSAPSLYQLGHPGTSRELFYWEVYPVVPVVAPLSTRALRAGRRNVCFKCLIEKSNCALFLCLFDCFF